jgi:hypothetical protein
LIKKAASSFPNLIADDEKHQNKMLNEMKMMEKMGHKKFLLEGEIYTYEML